MNFITTRSARPGSVQWRMCEGRPLTGILDGDWHVPLFVYATLGPRSGKFVPCQLSCQQDEAENLGNSSMAELFDTGTYQVGFVPPDKSLVSNVLLLHVKCNKTSLQLRFSLESGATLFYLATAADKKGADKVLRSLSSLLSKGQFGAGARRLDVPVLNEETPWVLCTMPAPESLTTGKTTIAAVNSAGIDASAMAAEIAVAWFAWRGLLRVNTV